jgi:mycothiol synthase
MTETRLVRANELRDVVRMVMRGQRPGSPQEAEGRADAMLTLMAAKGRSLAGCHAVTTRRGKPVAACLCFESPGRIGMLLLSPMGREEWRQQALGSAVRHVVRAAGGRDLNILQAVLEDGDMREAEVLEALGFRHLARLLYLDRSCALPEDEPPPRVEVKWRTYVPENHGEFARVIAATYEGSLDCPGLTGLRDIEDIIASHRATGEHDPTWWFLATVDGEGVGVLLLAGVPLRSALEVAYMGVAPAHRGRGLGRVLLRQALAVARSAGVGCLTLAVDAGNAPALRLYERFGFEPVASREAWIYAVRGWS